MPAAKSHIEKTGRQIRATEKTGMVSDDECTTEGTDIC